MSEESKDVQKALEASLKDWKRDLKANWKEAESEKEDEEEKKKEINTDFGPGYDSETGAKLSDIDLDEDDKQPW